MRKAIEVKCPYCNTSKDILVGIYGVNSVLKCSFYDNGCGKYFAVKIKLVPQITVCRLVESEAK